MLVLYSICPSYKPPDFISSYAIIVHKVIKSYESSALYSMKSPHRSGTPHRTYINDLHGYSCVFPLFTNKSCV